MLKQIISTVAACILFLNNLISIEEATHFVIVIPSYNNEKWCLGNMESCVNQSYSNWSLIYIDDNSTDQTAALVDNFIRTRGLQSKCTLIKNSERKGALENLHDAIHSCKPTDVILTVDGDDQLAHSDVLHVLAKAYSNQNVWMTYGNFKSSPAGWSTCGDYIPSGIARKRAFRSYKWVATHLRTFYAKLFQLIDKKDLLWEGKFFPMTWDMAIMFPMLEMASRNHYRFIPEVLYIYNVANPIMDWRVNAQLQRDLDTYIRNMPKYKSLKKLF